MLFPLSGVEMSEEFIWKNIIVSQKADVFKIGTDTLLLGNWTPKVVIHPKHILDAGTGSGILAMMMGHFFPDADIVAVDLDEAAVRLAFHNIRLFSGSKKFSVLLENILEPPFPDHPLYDLIICNPPFFFGQYKSPDELKKKTKHANESPDQWFKSLSVRLNSTGHLCVVVPFDNSSEWVESANECCYYCQHRLDVYSFRNDHVPIRTLLHFQTTLHKPEITRLDIYESTRVYTVEFLEFSGIQHQEHKA